MNRTRRAAEALGVRLPQNLRDKFVKAVTVMMAASGLLLNGGLAQAATLSSASVGLSDPRPSQASVNYTFTGSSVTSTAIKCVKVTFSTASSSVVTPTGFTAAGASVNVGASSLLTGSTGTWTPIALANTFTYANTTNTIVPGTTTGATFTLAGITNSSVADTAYFYKIATFSNNDCATGPLDNATVQFIDTNGSTLSLTVDNTLSFSVNAVLSATSCDGTTTTQASTATTIPFGTVTAASNGIVCQDLTAATNATNGYTIFARYTAKPANALAQTINDWTGTNATPTVFSAAGTEAYGITTNDATLGTGTVNRFTNPVQNWAALSVTNAEVAYEAAGLATGTYRIGHQVGISTTTRPGTYQTTVIYTCTPVY